MRAIQDLLKQIQDHRQKPPKLKQNQVSKLFQQCDKHFREANKFRTVLLSETIIMNAFTHCRECPNQVPQLEDQLEALKQEYEALKRVYDRDEVLPLEPEEQRNNGGGAGDQLLQEAAQMQDDIELALKRIKNQVYKAKEIGQQGVGNLQKQNEQLGKIQGKVERMDNNLGRANDLLKQFARCLATNRCLQSFISLLCLVLAVLVLYSMVNN